LEQLPDADLDREILVRTDIGGRTHPFTRDCREAGIRFSVGYEVDERMRQAILETPESAWQAAIDGEGKRARGRLGHPADRRRRSLRLARGNKTDRAKRASPSRRPVSGLRRGGLPPHRFHHRPRGTDIAALELRHRRRAKVENEIRCGKDTGMRNLPFAAFCHNRVWLELSLIAQELLA
jgi:Transposase DDE domain group 1